MTTCTLTTVIRQSGDPLFMRILNQLRIGHLSQEAETLLRSCHLSIKAMPDDGILPTKLYCTNKNVDMENVQQLKKTSTEATFQNVQNMTVHIFKSRLFVERVL